jgi:hypothetical protein
VELARPGQLVRQGASVTGLHGQAFKRELRSPWRSRHFRIGNPAQFDLQLQVRGLR